MKITLELDETQLNLLHTVLSAAIDNDKTHTYTDQGTANLIAIVEQIQ